MKITRWFLTVFTLAACLLTAVSAAEYDGYLVQMEPSASLLSGAEAGFPEMNEVYAPAGLYQTESVTTLEELRAMGVPFHAEPNYIVTLDEGIEQGAEALLLDAPDDSEKQWYDDRLDMDWVRGQGIRGAGVRVGIVDSGIFAEHQEFEGVRILSGANYCVKESDAARVDVSDTYGHGTFVSGLIAAAENGVGIIGIAPEVELVPLKCFEGRNGSIANIAAAIYDSVDTWHCQVLNLSLGLENDSTVLRRAVEYADNAGVLMVAAAGNLSYGRHNRNGDPLNYPAAYPQVIGVGSLDPTLIVSSFSYHNESVEICAPGQNLRAPSYTQEAGYATGYGTSYAAPIVTAAAALACSVRPGLTCAEFRDMMRDTALDLGPAGYDTSYGHGLLHVGYLMAALRGNLSHQIAVVRGRVAGMEADGLPPALLAGIYDANGALLAAEDVSPILEPKYDSDTTPILADGTASDEFPETMFRLPGAVSWKLFSISRTSFKPVQAGIALYNAFPDSNA